MIEVADSSLPYDRDIKLPLYARAGIPEAWLVDIEACTLTRFARPGPDSYRRSEAIEMRNAVSIATLPGLDSICAACSEASAPGRPRGRAHPT